MRLELLGGLRVVTGGRVAARVPGARQQEILAFLVLHARGGPIARQRCAAALWPDSTDPQALTNLRRELHHLREAWPELEALVEAGTRTLRWRGTDVDVIAFEAAADRGRGGDREALLQAARLYTGDLLPECAAEWITSSRDTLRQRAVRTLTRLAASLESERAFAEAIEHLQHLLRLEPLDEDAWRALMRCHARRGARATALHVYQECATLLKKELGVSPNAATRATYREILALDAAEPVSVPAPRTSVYPLVGRHAEWQRLLQAWRAAERDGPRLTLIRGESGIGKTRLAEELADWCRLNGVGVATARCYGGEGRLAYAPIAGWLRSDAVQAGLPRLDRASLNDVTRLHPAASARHADAVHDDQLQPWQRVRFFESLTQAFRSAAPIVLIADDLQWADADTIDWLRYFLRSASGAPCLIVAAVRAEEEQDNHAIAPLLRHLERDGAMTEIALAPLDEAASGQLACAVAERTLDTAALRRAYRETEGHPLFIVEWGRMDAAEKTGTPGGAAASRVHAVVAARLALLSEQAREAAEVASALGRDFRFDLLSEASGLGEDALVRALDELWRRQIVRAQADERWDFSHDRIREVTYAGIGPARARHVHRRIAQAIERLFAGRLDEVSASMAVHLDRGGQPARAVPYLERAAGVAMRVSAHEEAIRCLTNALALLEKLPAGRDRDARELALRSHLTIALNAGRGYTGPEVEQNLERVLQMFRAGERDEVPVRWLWVAFTIRFVRGEMSRARAIAEEALGRSVSDPEYRGEAHHSMAATLLCEGDLDGSRRHFEAAIAACDARPARPSPLGSDLGVFVRAWCAHPLWLLGEDEAALAHAAVAIALARERDHPFSLIIALAYAAMLHQMRRDTNAVLEYAEAVVSLCDKHGIAYYREWAQALIGWARALERPVEGIAIMESALAGLDAKRTQARRPYYLSLLAEAYVLAGRRDRAASLVDAAIAQALEQPDLWWLPALYLQKSELAAPPQREIARCMALDVARAQGSRALERRILAPSTAASI